MSGTIYNIPAHSVLKDKGLPSALAPEDQKKHAGDNLPGYKNHRENKAFQPSQDNAEHTELSTLSVIRFLEHLLEEHLKINEQNQKPSQDKWLPYAPANQNRAKHAAYAYAHAAEISKTKLNRLKPARPYALQKSDRPEDIYTLLRLLRDLYKQGQIKISLRQDLPFTESIRLAVIYPEN